MEISTSQFRNSKTVRERKACSVREIDHKLVWLECAEGEECWPGEHRPNYAKPSGPSQEFCVSSFMNGKL